MKLKVSILLFVLAAVQLSAGQGSSYPTDEPFVFLSSGDFVEDDFSGEFDTTVPPPGTTTTTQTTTTQAVTSSSTTTSQNLLCGVPAVTPMYVRKILGGREATPHSWPWQISIHLDGEHHCGGSIIGREWVLTAAHCIGETNSAYIARLTIVAGAHRLSVNNAGRVVVGVSWAGSHALHGGENDYYLAGLTAFGDACGTNSVGVYTEVQRYISWIQTRMRTYG
uniref:Peptidase S1 domain-containing protein n=1 Tax=Ciona savignyi TaxID=51511 RepID=H2Y7R7_CIOSA